MLASCQEKSQYSDGTDGLIGGSIDGLACIIALCYSSIIYADQPMEVIIYSRHNCHLCHVALRIARLVQADIPFTLHSIDIAQDTKLLALYGHRVPVVLIDQQERLAGKMTERELRAALKKTRWSKSISRILSRLGLHPNRG